MSLSSDEREWLHRIEDQIRVINDTVTGLRVNGCGKAPQHEDHERRLREIERSESERRGRETVRTTAISALVSGSFVLLGHLLK